MWSRNYTECIKCGENDTRHMADGWCARCYLKKYRKDNKVRIKKYKRILYILNKDLILIKAKAKREKRDFNGMRQAILKRDNYQCIWCGTKRNLVVHHKDKKGRCSKIKNNKKSNLVTLCKVCHIVVHKKELLQGKK